MENDYTVEIEQLKTKLQNQEEENKKIVSELEEKVKEAKIGNQSTYD